MNNRLSVTINEQRDLKKTWLAEKADLEKRYFQIQALNTQLSASLIKKEKEFVKLQNTLANLLKDKEKANKSTIMISSKASSTTSTASGLSSVSQTRSLKSSADSSSSSVSPLLLTAEISSLKNSKNYLVHELKQVQQQLIAKETETRGLISISNQNQLISDEKILFLQTTIHQLKEELEETKLLQQEQEQQHLLLCNQQEEEAAAGNSMALVVIASPQPTVSSFPPVPPPSTVGKIAKKYLMGTPGAKPMTMLLSAEEMNSQENQIHSSFLMIPPTTGKKHQQRQKDLYEELHQHHQSIAKQLAEAMIVIKEQDRIIHEGKKSLKSVYFSISDFKIFFSVNFQ
jgi:hypothetical protein